MYDNRWISGGLRCDWKGNDGLPCENRFSPNRVVTDIRSDARVAGWTTVSDLFWKVHGDYCPQHGMISIVIEEVDQPQLTPQLTEGTTR
jgi:hypothetical protein